MTEEAMTLDSAVTFLKELRAPIPANRRLTDEEMAVQDFFQEQHATWMASLKEEEQQNAPCPTGQDPEPQLYMTRAFKAYLYAFRHHLAGQDLRRVNLRKMDLQGADLQGANLQEACMVGANLQGADLREVDLQEACMVGANLQGAHMGAAHMVGVDLRGAILDRADMVGVNLLEGDLRRARLRRAILQEAWMPGVNLDLADLGRAILVNAHMQGASIKGAILVKASIQGANLDGADLQGADLREAMVGKMQMRGVQHWDKRPTSMQGVRANGKTNFGGFLVPLVPGEPCMLSFNVREDVNEEKVDYNDSMITRIQECLQEAILVSTYDYAVKIIPLIPMINAKGGVDFVPPSPGCDPWAAPDFGQGLSSLQQAALRAGLELPHTQTDPAFLEDPPTQNL